MAIWLNKKEMFMKIKRILATVAMVAMVLLLPGCQSTKSKTTLRDLDLESYIGDRYLIASKPTFIENDAIND